MAFIQSVLGIATFPQELQNLSLKYFCLQVIVSGIYLSHAWISLYYISILDSFSVFGFIVSIGMLCGAFLDLPLGILTDRFGQRIAFSGAMFCLLIYYFGLIFATNAFEFLILEIVVGIYSALISGSFISWFMNSWESLDTTESGNNLLFRNVMGNISFAKTIIIAIMTFLGGFVLQQNISPQIIFIGQSLIAMLGVFLGLKFIVPSKIKNNSESNEIQTKDIFKPLSSFLSKLKDNFSVIKDKYLKIVPFFFSFSILAFTSASFSSLIFSPLLYELGSKDQSFASNDIIVQFTAISLLFISLTKAFSNIIFAIFSRLSGKVTSFIKSPYKGMLVFYILDYPIVWLLYSFILLLSFPLYFTIVLFILVFLLKVILNGLSTGIYWQLYYKITSSKNRSSQESLFNTINLIISLIGFWLIGMIIESYNFIGALIFLFLISGLGVFVFILAKNPNSHY